VCSGANATIVNCTLVGNSSSQSRGGGISAGSFDSTTQIVNVIVADNIGGGIELGSLPEPSISYGCFYQNHGGSFVGAAHDSLGFPVMVNSNGDSCDMFYNIFLDPEFVDTLAGNYHLLATSPCIDAGDPTSPLDPDSTVADIGAFYFDQSTGMDPWSHTEPPVTFGLLQNYPNPFNASTEITLSLPNAGNVVLTVSNVLGQRVATLLSGYQLSGNQHIFWDARDVASGIYFARLQSAHDVKVIKMVLLK